MKNDNSALSLIQRNLLSMAEAERKVADYILKNSDSVIYMTTKTIAKKTGVSEGTIIKFSTKLGFSGFSELKINIAQQMGPENNYIFDNVTKDDTPKHAFKKMIDNMVSTLNTTYSAISDAEMESIATVLQQAGRIELYGVGSSSMVVNDIYYRLMRIGLPAYAVTDPHISAVSASMLDKNAVAIGVSHSGRTVETLSTMTIAKKRGAKTICVTSYAASPLAKLCDYTIVIASKESEVNKEAVTARLAQLLIFDSLCLYISSRDDSKAVNLMDNVIDIIAEHRKQ